jgi:cytochrome b subunit of formate dehydrogenase
MKFGEMLVEEFVQAEWSIKQHRTWTEEEG